MLSNIACRIIYHGNRGAIMYFVLLDKAKWSFPIARELDTHWRRSWICQCRLASGGSASWSGVDVSSAGQNWFSLLGQEISCLPLSVAQWCHLKMDTFKFHMRKCGIGIQSSQLHAFTHCITVVCYHIKHCSLRWGHTYVDSPAGHVVLV